MKIVFCASEVVPFAKTGGLADVCGTLPLALEQLGHQLVIVTPRYKTSNRHIPTPIVKVGANIRVCFVEHDHYFGREGLYGEDNRDYHDNLERFAFFCHKTFQILKDIHFQPDIMHCHDWHTSLIPILLKTNYAKDPFFKKTASVLTIHNLAYQGIFPKHQYSKLGLEANVFHTQGVEFYDQINFLKGGIVFADTITTVSPQYAKEIQTPDLGCSLQGVLRNRHSDIYGILNGLDYDAWNPADDPFLDVPYHAGATAHRPKLDNKLNLQSHLGLALDGNIPLFSFVGRLCHQKGVDLIMSAMPHIIHHGAQIVFAGVGDKKYHRMIEEAAGRWPKNVGCYLHFDERMVHKIYAACDFFLMPSVYEPCGLGQMIALRFGAIPIVHKTGGLADTIHPGNGFVFTPYTKEAFCSAFEEALKVYAHKDRMQALVTHALHERFTWEKSARDYERVYQKCIL